jgi:hypothetical protein
VRDSFENPKQDLEGRLSEILGQPWTIKVDPLALYAYAEEGSWASTSLGDLIVRFVSSYFPVSVTCEVILHSFKFHSLKFSNQDLFCLVMLKVLSINCNISLNGTEMEPKMKSTKSAPHTF